MSRFDRMEAKIIDQELRLVNAADEIVSLKKQIQQLVQQPVLTDEKVIAFSPRTCQEALDSGLPEYKTSGMYWIDPDGLGIGDGAIYVFCDMTTGQF
jgi:hypothetical protein